LKKESFTGLLFLLFNFLIFFITNKKQEEFELKIKYNNGVSQREIEVNSFYEDIAKLLIKEEVEDCTRVVEITSEYGKAVYEVSVLVDLLKVRELQNTMPEELGDEGLKPCYLFKDLIIASEKHDFYEMTPNKTDVSIKYGRKGDKSSMFSEHRTYTIPKRMYWIKKYEKIANGHADAEQLNFKLRKKMLL